MTGLWKAFVLVVALAVVACEARRRLQNYDDIVDLAVETYNKGQRGKPLFRLLNVTVPSSQNPTTNVPLRFTIKETTCIAAPGTRPEDCGFLEDGEERNCTGEFFTRRRSTSLTLTCDRDCRGEGAQVSSFADYVASNEEDKFKGLPPRVRDIYENAKYDIIGNILRNF